MFLWPAKMAMFLLPAKMAGLCGGGALQIPVSAGTIRGMATRFLYFDVGNVLLAFSHAQMCRRMAAVAGISADAVKNVLFDAEGAAQLLCDFETGRVSPDDFYGRFCQATGSQPDRDRLRQAAVDIFVPIEPVWELVLRLATASHRLGLLSNSNAMHWEFITGGRFPLLAGAGTPDSIFPVAVASQQVGAMKPDPRIFQVAIERAGVAAGDVFFVDDRPENIAAARAAGIDAVQFSDPDALLAELATRGI